MLRLSIEVLIVLALIGVNGLLAMAEIALVSSRKVRLEQYAEKGSSGARVAIELASEPTRFLSTVQVGITLVGILAGAFGGASIADRLSVYLVDAGVSDGLAGTLSVVLVVLAITYLSLVFGELVPKRIGMQSPERIASLTAGPMRFISRAAAPVITVLSGSTSAVLALLRVKPTEASAMTDEEIRILIGESAESGSVNEAEAELLDRVFHFGDRRVHEVMVPRTEAVFLPADATVRDFYEVFADSTHSRFPVFGESQDNVIGVLGIKDVLQALANGYLKETSPIRPLVRPAYFVPEIKPVFEVFREMQRTGAQMAVLIDEFGGVAGIVTLEQLLEEMVGQVGDELNPAEDEVHAIDEHTNLVDGSLSVEEAREELEMDIPEGPYATIAGFVLDVLGHVPVEGEQVSFDGHSITVAEMRGPKIERLRVTKAST